MRTILFLLFAVGFPFYSIAQNDTMCVDSTTWVRHIAVTDNGYKWLQDNKYLTAESPYYIIDFKRPVYDHFNKWKVILVYVSSIALNAVGDALNDNNRKGPGHLLNALSIGVLVTSPFYVNYRNGKWYQYLLSYTFIRLAIFDPIYNKTRGLNYYYLDNFTPTDRILNYFDGSQYIRTVSLVMGIAIPLNFKL